MAGEPFTALYPGTFDALTYGHIDIIRRSAKTFDKLVVAVAHNDEKAPIFSVEDRLKTLQAEVGDVENVEVASFTGLTVRYALKIGARVIIRGLRVASDFEYELQMAMMNRQMEEGVETVFVTPSPETFFVSSSLVKEILHQGGDISGFVPPTAEKMLRKKFGPPGNAQ